MSHKDYGNDSRNDYESNKPRSATPRVSPCASCPYRRAVPSGVWSAEEYAKLPRYDGDIPDQIAAGGTRVFMCHQAEGDVCSGWLGHRDPDELVAVRLGIMRGDIDPACAEYTTNVELFSSGDESAKHGLKEITKPSQKAQDTISKITKKRSI